MHEHLPAELAGTAREVISGWELESMEDVILKATRPRIQFESSTKPSKSIAGTFAGGIPEMPSGMQWPRHEGGLLPFIAQINLAALPVLPAHSLPASGILYFFYWCTNECPVNPYRVLWTDSDAAALKRVNVAEAEILPDWQGVRVYEQSRTTFISIGISLSKDLLNHAAVESGYSRFLEDDGFGDFPFVFESEVELELAGGELCITDHFVWGQSLGYLDLEELLDGLTPSESGYYDGEQTWVNLLEVMSGGNMLWGDVGSLAFLLRQSDLERRSFESVQAQVLST